MPCMSQHDPANHGSGSPLVDQTSRAESQRSVHCCSHAGLVCCCCACSCNCCAGVKTHLLPAQLLNAGQYAEVLALLSAGAALTSNSRISPSTVPSSCRSLSLPAAAPFAASPAAALPSPPLSLSGTHAWHVKLRVSRLLALSGKGLSVCSAILKTFSTPVPTTVTKPLSPGLTLACVYNRS